MKKSLTPLVAILVVVAALFLVVTGGEMGSSLTQTSTLDDFLGKPSAVVFGGTYCPHCQNAVPQLEEQVWDVYAGDANIWVQVVDGAEGKTFDTTMAQGYNANLDYAGLAGEECGYVPSWVVMDAEGETVMSSCGSEHGIDEMAGALEGLL